MAAISSARLAVIPPPLGVADLDVAAAEVGEHRGRDVARVRDRHRRDGRPGRPRRSAFPRSRARATGIAVNGGRTNRSRSSRSATSGTTARTSARPRSEVRFIFQLVPMRGRMVIRGSGGWSPQRRAQTASTSASTMSRERGRARIGRSAAALAEAGRPPDRRGHRRRRLGAGSGRVAGRARVRRRASSTVALRVVERRRRRAERVEDRLVARRGVPRLDHRRLRPRRHSGPQASSASRRDRARAGARADGLRARSRRPAARARRSGRSRRRRRPSRAPSPGRARPGRRPPRASRLAPDAAGADRHRHPVVAVAGPRVELAERLALRPRPPRRRPGSPPAASLPRSPSRAVRTGASRSGHSSSSSQSTQIEAPAISSDVTYSPTRLRRPGSRRPRGAAGWRGRRCRGRGRPSRRAR